MNEPPTVPPATEFKDRRTGLIVFGILEILLGCLCVLLIPLMFWGQAMSARMTGGETNYRMVIPSALMYGILAVSFIWLGIGSLKCRRWARALLLMMAWSWLLVGVLSTGFASVLLPKVMAMMPPGGARMIGLVIVFAALGIIFILIPGVMVFFYQSKHVKATCEARDPVVRWTDSCPLPVLAASLWLGFGALAMLAMPLSYNSVLPVFGVLVSGLPGTLLFIILAGLWAYLAWGFYLRRVTALWITLGMLLLFSASNFITFTKVDLLEMYQQMGYSEQQIEQMRNFDFFSGKFMAWFTLLFLLPLCGYLLWVKRYFQRSA
jgi:hypothetical protein